MLNKSSPPLSSHLEDVMMLYRTERNGALEPKLLETPRSLICTERISWYLTLPTWSHDGHDAPKHSSFIVRIKQVMVGVVHGLPEAPLRRHVCVPKWNFPRTCLCPRVKVVKVAVEGGGWVDFASPCRRDGLNSAHRDP